MLNSGFLRILVGFTSRHLVPSAATGWKLVWLSALLLFLLFLRTEGVNLTIMVYYTRPRPKTSMHQSSSKRSICASNEASPRRCGLGNSVVLECWEGSGPHTETGWGVSNSRKEVQVTVIFAVATHCYSDPHFPLKEGSG